MTEYPTARSHGYYSDPRGDLSQFIIEGPNRILDVGCGEGRAGAALKAAGRAREVVGIEKNVTVAETARGNIDQVICADIERLALPFDKASFDYVVFGDVLEHLVDPWDTVDRLTELLREGGHIIASIPNVRYWRVVLGLILKGKWQYGSDGVLDDTHLRFFTANSMQRLFRGPTLMVKQTVSSLRFETIGRACRVNHLTFRLFEDFLTVRYILEVQKV